MILIKTSHIQFKNPKVGQPTRSIAEHYNGRRIVAEIEGEEQLFRFKKAELDFDIEQEDMILAIEQRLAEEKIE